MILLLRGIVTKNIALSIETHKEREDKTMKVVFSSLSLFVKFLTNKINKFDKNSARLHSGQYIRKREVRDCIGIITGCKEGNGA